MVLPIYAMFLSAVIEWDVTTVKDGPLVPLTVEGLRENKIAGRVIGYLWTEIMKDYRLGEPNAADGSTGSLPAANSERPPTTGPSSGLPAMSTT